jgi:hypothetical protein
VVVRAVVELIAAMVAAMSVGMLVVAMVAVMEVVGDAEGKVAGVVMLRTQVLARDGSGASRRTRRRRKNDGVFSVRQPIFIDRMAAY